MGAVPYGCGSCAEGDPIGDVYVNGGTENEGSQVEITEYQMLRVRSAKQIGTRSIFICFELFRETYLENVFIKGL